MEMNLKDMLPNIFGGGTKKRKMKVTDAFDYLVQEEEGRLIDMDAVNRAALERVNRTGSSFWTRSTRLPGEKADTDLTSRARACSATSCPLSKARP